MYFRCAKIFALWAALSIAACSQADTAESHSIGEANGETVDNFVHAPGYETAPLGTLEEVIRRGNGPVPVIMLTGGGLSANIFEQFMAANEGRYTMYAFTKPGYGGTKAPPMPAEDTPWSERSWSRGFEQAIAEFVENNELEGAVLVGHFSGVQNALHLAVANPELFSRVVLIAGEPARGPSIPNREQAAAGMANNWFRTVTEQDWREGNFPPSTYTRDARRAAQIWDQSIKPTVPVNVRYLVEFMGSDIRTQLDGYRVPTLILLPDLDDSVPPSAREFFENWDAFRQHPDIFTFERIEDAHIVMWEDNPEATYEAINRFVSQER